MLTEDQLAATFDAIETTAVERLILVGDPRQLPPIGAGRPFVDIVRFLKSDSSATTAEPPRGYAELKTVRRQTEGAASSVRGEVTTRDDVVLSRWFGGEAPDPGSDEAWDGLAADTAVGIRAVRWDTDGDLQAKLLADMKDTVREIARRQGFTEGTEEALFEISLGGRPFGSAVYFHPSSTRDGQSVPGAGASAESWQVLSPLRAGETGVDGLNRRIQGIFRHQARAWAEPEKYWHRKTCKLLGTQNIRYGDKVIMYCTPFSKRPVRE